MLRIYAGLFSGTAAVDNAEICQLSLHLSDNSAPDVTDQSVQITNTANAYRSAVFHVLFSAGSANQTLTVTWQFNASTVGAGAYVFLGGATLNSPLLDRRATLVTASTTQSLSIDASVSTLTPVQQVDWMQFGHETSAPYADRRTVATPLIANYTVNGRPSRVTTNYTGFSWTDGTPTTSVAETGGSGTALSLGTAGNYFQFTVPASPSPSTAGAAGSFTVTAKDAYGNTNTSFLDTVTFTSSDGQAVLPLNYTFQVSDNGTHTFTATLKTAGTQSITAADTGTSTIKGTQSGIIVTPAATANLAIAFPSPITAGTPGDLTVTAKDLYGNTAEGYRGTVYFTSSDGQAVLPGPYTFVAGDSGVHTFTNEVMLETAGTQSITATDTVTSSITGTQSGIAVNAAAADPNQSTASASPGSVRADGVEASTVTVTIKDAYGNGCSGKTVTLAGNPATSSITPASAVTNSSGVATFTVTSTTIGPVTYTATDTTDSIAVAQTPQVTFVSPVTIVARETVDANGNGYIDAIRIVTSGPLNDNFAGLKIAVTGYTVVGYDTGGTANDAEFFVRLAEGARSDTGATPGVQVVADGSLGLPVDPQPVAATDKAKPLLMTASWYDGSNAGVDANDPIYLTFSEPVTSNSALPDDFGLPVSNDTYGTGASVY